jgi:aspartate aminotransferase
MKNPVKDNVKKINFSATLSINEKTKRLISKGKTIYKFGFGLSPFPVPGKIVEVFKKNAFQNEYLPMQGLPALRDEIAKNLTKNTKNKLTRDNVLITPGSKTSMYLMHMCFNGDVIIPQSSWVSYAPQARLAKNKIHWLETREENNWFPDAKDLEKKLKKLKSKNITLFLNSPNNPSGLTCKNLKELARVARKYKIFILSDEVYGDLTFSGNYESISTYYPEGTFISGGLSKWCGAGGWRLGFLTVPNQHKDFLTNLNKLASEAYSTVNSPTQFAAVEAYKENLQEYKTKTKNILSAVGKYVSQRLQSYNVRASLPEGGFYLMMEIYSKKFKTSDALSKAMLDQIGIASLPGSVFGFKPSQLIVRLAFTDFNGTIFLKKINTKTYITDELIEKYAPRVAEGVNKLAAWIDKQ